jgi:superoxide reductase
MTAEHHIALIAVVEKCCNKVQVAKLDTTDKPEAKFKVCGDNFTVYEYCNLHGLWSAGNK